MKNVKGHVFANNKNQYLIIKKVFYYLLQSILSPTLSTPKNIFGGYVTDTPDL